MNKKISLIFLFVFIALFAYASSGGIEINSQQGFDRLENNIKEILRSGCTDVNVYIRPGVYLFSSYHLNLSNLNYPNASIYIKGEEAKVVSSSDGKARQSIANEHNISFLNDDFSTIHRWSETIHLEDKVEVVNKDDKLCRIRIPDKYHITKSPKYVNITKWYLNGIYKVQQVIENYIYFTVTDLKQGNNPLLAKYDINNDFGYGHSYPRCQLYYGEPASFKYKCVNSQFLTMGYTKLKNLTISRLDFVGNAGNGSLLVVNDCKFQSFEVQNCSFRNIQDVILYAIKTDNVTFNKNVVRDCNGSVMISEDCSRNTRFTNNKITNVGLHLNNIKAVQCVSENFLISGNTFCNFSYAAIGSGLSKNAKPSSKCSGIIEDNEIFMDVYYYSNASNHTLMDSGAIYLGTITHGVLIRNNYIHDIAGAKDNRGIFCDDGTKNVTITGNVIQRIQNSYAIDLRNVPSVADKVPDHNTGNVCQENLVDCDIRFYLRDESCKMTSNKMFGDVRYKRMKTYKNWKRKIKI